MDTEQHSVEKRCKEPASCVIFLLICLFKTVEPLLVALQDQTGIRETNDPRKEHSFQIGGNDDECNDLRWFRTGLSIVWKLMKPKKCQASKRYPRVCS